MFINLQGRRALVVGAGPVGRRKVRTLADCGAKVIWVAPHMPEPLGAELANVTEIVRPFRDADLQNVFLVIAATDDAALNLHIFRQAQQQGILCNVVDQPEKSHFIVPAAVSQGDLTLAISTAGASPALAKRLRRELAERYGPGYAQLLELMKAIRKRLLDEDQDSERHKALFHQLLDDGLLQMVEAGQIEQIDQLLQKHLGSDWCHAGLMNRPANASDDDYRD